MATPDRPATVIWREGDQPDPVSAENPLVGIELEVLRIWTETSPNVRKALRRDRAAVEAAVRRRVFDAHVEQMKLRAQGMPEHEATSPAHTPMWKPPTFPTTST